MITETEAQTRAEYMGLVRHQLRVLRQRTDLDPQDYAGLLERSSLKLGEIEWVREMMNEGVRIGRHVEVLDRLIMYYEGYFEALARVLEARPDDLFATFDQLKVRRLEDEMHQVLTRRVTKPKF